jgi:hypothetical protein
MVIYIKVLVGFICLTNVVFEAVKAYLSQQINDGGISSWLAFWSVINNGLILAMVLFWT